MYCQKKSIKDGVWHKKLHLWCFASLFFFAHSVQAQSLEPAKREVIAIKADNPFLFTGYIDGSYNYLANSNLFTSSYYDRSYDVNENGFTLQQAAATLAYQPSLGFGALTNVVLGHDAEFIAPYGMNTEVTGEQVLNFALVQTYIQYATPTAAIQVGELLSLAGAEQVDYTKNVNFSRSILYQYAQPGTHIGLRGKKDLSERWNLIFGINNGWDTIHNALHMNTIELGLSCIVSEWVSWTIDGYFSNDYMTDDATGGPRSLRSVIDAYSTINFNHNWSMILNYDYGDQRTALLPDATFGRAVWQGLAVNLNYIVNDKWVSSVRGEVFSDGDGYRTGVRQTWDELTFTVGYFLFKQFELRAETRHDFSNVHSFLQKTGTGTANYQQSYALEGLFSF